MITNRPKGFDSYYHQKCSREHFHSLTKEYFYKSWLLIDQKVLKVKTGGRNRSS